MNADEVPIGRKEKRLDKMKVGSLCYMNDGSFLVDKLRVEFCFTKNKIRDNGNESYPSVTGI